MTTQDDEYILMLLAQYPLTPEESETLTSLFLLSVDKSDAANEEFGRLFDEIPEGSNILQIFNRFCLYVLIKSLT